MLSTKPIMLATSVTSGGSILICQPFLLGLDLDPAHRFLQLGRLGQMDGQ
jgi:hypothetical protein